MGCETRSYDGYTLPYKLGIPNRFDIEDALFEDLIDAVGTNRRGFGISVFGSNEQVSAGDGVVGFAVPESMNNLNMVGATATVYIKGVTGSTSIQIRRRRSNVDADMLSTQLTLGDQYYSSNGVIDEDNDDIQTGDQIYVDVDTVHSGDAPFGLSVTVEFL